MEAVGASDFIKGRGLGSCLPKFGDATGVDSPGLRIEGRRVKITAAGENETA